LAIHEENSEELFQFKLFQCLDLALSTIGEYEKERTLIALEKKYGLSGRDLARYPDQLEVCLKEILGISEAAFVIIHVCENIVNEFGFHSKDLSSLSKAIELASTRYSSSLTNTPHVYR
jgi:hypothetical protein